MFIFFAILAWLACSISAAGLLVAYYQRQYPGLAKRDYHSDLRWALWLSLIAGPIAIVSCLVDPKYWCHGWTLLPPKE